MNFNIINHGSLIGFTPIDDSARDWWEENVQDCQQMAGQYFVETRYAQDIIDGIQAASVKQQAGEGGPPGRKL
tara:strand:- start:10 stop:228 length:219 start_codon:yes stop_codon:yes gene_type:complete